MAVDTLDEKAQADTAPLGGFESLANQKVQLDIDDAPFLDEPEEAPPPPPAPVEKKEVATKAPPKEEPKKGKKKLIIAGVGLVLLLGVAAALYFLVFSKEPPPQPPIIEVIQPKAPPPGPTVYNLALQPFTVELMAPDGRRRFLNAAFVLTTQDVMAYTEAEDKVIILRDSIYYYLRNQDYDFLHNPANTGKIRQDLITAVNDYLVQGKMADVLFDTYLIR